MRPSELRLIDGTAFASVSDRSTRASSDDLATDSSFLRCNPDQRALVAPAVNWKQQWVTPSGASYLSESVLGWAGR